jgi:YD repeat-containing protein
MARLPCLSGFYLLITLILSLHSAASAAMNLPAALSTVPHHEAAGLGSGDVLYVYDELGRLVAVIDPTGDTAIYAYDAVGNLLSIARQSSSSVAIIEFTPNGGAASSSVTLYGTGFSTTPSQNTVTFNGTAASVTSSTGNQIVTSVPVGATTGPIAVTTPTGSASSSTPFTITASSGAPTITGFNPTIGVPGTAVSIMGANFETTALNNRATVNIVNSTITAATSTSIDVSTPMAGSGRISVTTPNGTATSTGDFIIPPPTYAVADVMITGRMSIGGSSTTVNVNTAGKIGLMLFDGLQGQRVYLNITNVSMSGNAYVNIYNPDRTLLVSNTVSFTNPDFTDATTLPATGTYTIMVDPWISTSTGTVTLTLSNVLPDITGSITPGGAPVPISIATFGQNARLTFNGTAAQRVSLRLTGVTIGSSTTVTIYNPNGTTLASDIANVSYGGWIDATTLPAAGAYTILVDPNANNTGNATLALHDVVDINSSITPGGASVPVVIATPGQNARYAFSGITGQLISLNITGVTALGTDVYVYKPDGSTLASVTNLGSSGAFIDTKTLTTNGTYTILVDPTAFYIGNVTLKLHDIVHVTGPITAGGSAVMTTVANPGQNVSLTFDGIASQRVSLKISGVTIGSTTPVNILKPDGTVLVMTNANASSGGWLEPTTLPVTGAYTIFANPNSNNIGNMTFNLYDVAADTTGTVTIGGGAVPVTITTPGQNGQLTLDGTSAQQVTVRITSNTMSLVTVKLLKPDGTTLTMSTTGASSFNLAQQTLPTTGTYTIKIDPNTFNTGSMNVSVTSP